MVSPPMISPITQVVAITTFLISTLALIEFTMSIPPAEPLMSPQNGVKPLVVYRTRVEWWQRLGIVGIKE